MPIMPIPKWASLLAYCSICLFPIISLSVNHGGSTLYALLGLMAFFYAWPEWGDSSTREKWLILGYVLLFGVAVLSLVHVQDWDNSFRRLHRIFRVCTFGAMFLFLRRTRIEVGKPFLLGVGAAAVWSAAQAWYQVVIEKTDWAVGLYQHIIFGDMSILMAAVLVAAMVTVIPHWPMRIGVAFLAGLACYASILSLARGAWLFAPVSLVLVGILYRRQLFRSHKWLIVGVVMLCGVGVAVGSNNSVRDRVNQTVASARTFFRNPAVETSLSDRFNLWRNSLLIWKENPLLGTGIGDFRHDNLGLIAEGRSWSRAVGRLGQPQSVYFSALATMGLAGLVVVVLSTVVIPFGFFLHHWRGAAAGWPRFYALAGMLSVAAFATFGLSEHWLGRNPFVNSYIFYILAFAGSLSVCRLENPGLESSP